MISITKKISEIITYYQISGRQFALKIGVNQSVIGSMFQKGTEPSSKVIQLTAISFPEISLDWFIRDEGDMFKTQAKEIDRLNNLIDTITILQKTINEKSTTIDTLNECIRKLEVNQ